MYPSAGFVLLVTWTCKLALAGFVKRIWVEVSASPVRPESSEEEGAFLCSPCKPQFYPQGCLHHSETVRGGLWLGLRIHMTPSSRSSSSTTSACSLSLHNLWKLLAIAMSVLCRSKGPHRWKMEAFGGAVFSSLRESLESAEGQKASRQDDSPSSSSQALLWIQQFITVLCFLELSHPPGGRINTEETPSLCQALYHRLVLRHSSGPWSTCTLSPARTALTLSGEIHTALTAEETSKTDCYLNLDFN